MNKYTHSILAALALLLPCALLNAATGGAEDAAGAPQAQAHTKRLPPACETHLVAKVQGTRLLPLRQQAVFDVLAMTHPDMPLPTHTAVYKALTRHQAHFHQPDQWVDQMLATLGVPEFNKPPLFYKAAKGGTAFTGSPLTIAQLMATLYEDAQDVYMVLALENNGIVYQVTQHPPSPDNHERFAKAIQHTPHFSNDTPFFYVASGSDGKMIGPEGLLIQDILEVVHKKPIIFIQDPRREIRSLEFKRPPSNITYENGEDVLCTLCPSTRSRANSSTLRRRLSSITLTSPVTPTREEPEATAAPADDNTPPARRGSFLSRLRSASTIRRTGTPDALETPDAPDTQKKAPDKKKKTKKKKGQS